MMRQALLAASLMLRQVKCERVCECEAGMVFTQLAYAMHLLNAVCTPSIHTSIALTCSQISNVQSSQVMIACKVQTH